jgi:eukaryotic-like serine/threonine-protein kinase
VGSREDALDRGKGARDDERAARDEGPTLAAIPSKIAVERGRPPQISLPDMPALDDAAMRASVPSGDHLTAITTAKALHDEEAARAVAFARAMTVLCLFGVAALPFLYDRSRPLYWPMAGTIGLLGSLGLAMWWRVRRAKRYTRPLFRAFAFTFAFAVLFVEYDLGIFSPAPLFIVLGISYFGQSHDRRFAITVPILVAASYFLIALLVVVGVLPDIGLFSIRAASERVRLLMLVLVPLCFLVALWQARLSRRATIAAISQSNEALRLVLKRDAQLREANQNLDIALRAGAGKSGRYTGLLVGRYRLAEVVGRGAMGEIYAATHLDTGARAAVKLLQANASTDPDLLERFFREGRIAARLSAPNIVTVFDVGGSDDGAPYIAMELLHGHDLAHHLRQRQQLDLPEVIALVQAVAHGLAAAHEAGVVHRDLKPQNIFHAEQGEGRAAVWKILDFGVSKLHDSTGTITHAAVIGTPGYMSPEQALGRDTDFRSDLFSLGAVAYRALTGRPPFSGDMPHVLLDIAYKSPIQPSELAPALPADVDRVLAVALSKQPDHRFASALELSLALEAAARGALDPAVRARADAALGAVPWGAALVTPML